VGTARPALASRITKNKDVDGRDKPGHDESEFQRFVLP
jgi:hypothetical protein